MREVFDALSPCSPLFVANNKMYVQSQRLSVTHIPKSVKTQPSVAQLELMAKGHFDEDVDG